MASFNLIDRSWIPCLLVDGQAEDLSLRDTLLRADMIRELFDPSPLVTASLYRLLLAVLHAAHRGPANPEAWAAIWQARAFDAALLETYFMKWGDRFDLFDAVRPFYQPQPDDSAKLSPIQRLLQEVASGNTPLLFDHTTDTQPLALAPAEAARALIAVQGYSFAGTGGFYDTPHIRGYSVFVHSDTNLFETLTLNLITPVDQPAGWAESQDTPTWERDGPPVSGAAVTPGGYLEFLSWQARAVRLEPDDDGTVRGCRIKQLGVLKDESALDPFKSYYKHEKLGWRQRFFVPGRAVWRDSHALFVSTDAGRRPRVLDHVDRVSEIQDDAGEYLTEPAYAIDALGLCTEPGKAISLFWRQDRLPLPVELLSDEALQSALHRALVAAETTARSLVRAGEWLAALLLRPELVTPSDMARLSAQMKRQIASVNTSFQLELRYWARLDDAFAAFLSDLVDDRAVVSNAVVYGQQRAIPGWARRLRRCALDVFTEAVGEMADSPRALRAVAEAEQRLDRGLWRGLGELMPKLAAAAGVEEEV